jgi:hypothetical protein
MFALLDCVDNSPVFHFTYTTPGLDSSEWHHSTPQSPLANWVDDVLIPRAMERGDLLDLRDVVQTLYDQAQQARIAFEDLDWLGLALLATLRFRNSLGQLTVQMSPSLQAECAARSRLADICCQIYEELSFARHDSLRQWLTSAA